MSPTRANGSQGSSRTSSPARASTSTRSSSPRTRAADSPSAPATCSTSAPSISSTCAGAIRSPTTSAPRSSSSRLASFTAAASCRCSAAGAKRRRSASTGSGSTRQRDEPDELRVHPPYASGHLTLRPTRKYLLLRGGVEWTKWSQEPGIGSFPSVETVYTPATLPGLGADVTYVHTQGTRGLRLAHLRRLFATRRVLRRHGARLQRQRQGVRLPAGRLRG